MDIEERMRLIKGVGEEVVTKEELRQLLETKTEPVAYDGFEPSGLAHLPVGVYRPLILKDLLNAGVKFKLLLADSFAWINNKFGGDLEKIREAGEYFIEVWKAAGVDMKKVEVIWHKEFFDNPEYWKKVVLVARNHTLRRTMRSLAIAGRGEDISQPTAFVFYPSMQCADIFHIKADICQLGMDQRKVNMLAREIASKKALVQHLNYSGCGVGGKPVIVSHHMLIGLEGLKDKEESSLLKVQAAINAKMSKSKPSSANFVHDTRKEIKNKIRKAYCPAKIAEGNPILDYSREIIFRAFDELTIERPEKFGGDITYYSYEKLEKDYITEKLHPMDLKISVAEYLNKLIEPIRDHFEKDRRARELYENIASYDVTR
ncbi:tyrosyl-tRNA synthetase [archaeon]|nr:tyrosyl-tRNA synthetase [archaeon]